MVIFESTFNHSESLVSTLRGGNKLVYQFRMSSFDTTTLGRRGGSQMRQWLLEMLASGRYVAGSKLPTERAVADQLGVPRSAVRWRRWRLRAWSYAASAAAPSSLSAPERFEHWHAALHQIIAEATHNRLVIAIYTAITRARHQADWGRIETPEPDT
jgi:DNA-binding FadR family transcriptional regulator